MNRDALLNLCVDSYVVRCEATLVNADGYPPSNLTSSDPAARARGFQLEHFVRPPVSLEVELSRRVRVAVLVLHIALPEGAECRLEVFGSPGGEDSYAHCAGATLRGCEVLFLRNRSYGTQIAQGVPPVVEVIGSYLPPDLTDRNRMEQPFKACSSLNAMKRLKLSVCWLSGHLPLRVKAMEMWGIPCDGDVLRGSADCHHPCTTECGVVTFYNAPPPEKSGSCPQATPGACRSTCGSNSRACVPTGDLQSGEGGDPTSARSRSPSHSTAALQRATDLEGKRCSSRTQSVLPPSVVSTTTPTVPSRLLDEITYETMLIPMLLPSGHYVDQSTVHKLEQMDLLYGRRPCDPFTGVPFSATNRPIFCAELKCQLDALVSDTSPPCEATVGGYREIRDHLNLTGGRDIGDAAQVKRQASDARQLKPSKKLRADFDDLGTKFDLVSLPGLFPSDPVLSTPDHNATTSERVQSQLSRKCGHSQQEQHEAEVASSLVQALGLLYSTQSHNSTPESKTLKK